MKQWIVRSDPPEVILRNHLGVYPELLGRLLYYRGIENADTAEEFLNPSYERDIHDPFLAFGMHEATERIVRAIRGNERIVVFGDYDADGIPGAALLHSLLVKIGYQNFSVYIPDRYSEEYGLSLTAIDKFAVERVKLVVTVDCGITDVEEVEYATQKGIDVIITDHHLPHDRLPPAFAVINNKQINDEYPFKYLCGAGTAWKLACALLSLERFGVPTGWEKWLLDLAGISTVCDMVPLLGENRAIVHFGLKVLRRSPRSGLQVLLARRGVRQEEVTEDDVGFVIGPRINIASRMTHGVDAFNLLTTEDFAVANILVDQLEARNAERKQTVQIIIDEIGREFSEANPPPIIARGNKNWRIGVLGLTANRLMERYERPICLWSYNNLGEVKGSIRSDGTVNVVELMAAAGGDKFFRDFGGHQLSGGFSLAPELEPELEPRLISAYNDLRTNDSEFSKIYIDARLLLADVNEEKYLLLEKLSPFGAGNPKPQFLFENLEIISTRVFGNNGNRHLEISCVDVRGEKRNATAFFKDPSSWPAVSLDPGRRIDLVATLEKSNFRQTSEYRLRIVDLRPRLDKK